MASYRTLRDFDWALLSVAFVICAIGVLQIFSATLDTTWSDAWWKQLIWISVGLVLMWSVTLIDYHTLLGRVPLLYGLSVLGLLATLIGGRRVFGAQRWLVIGGFRLQISEFVKLVIILLVARYLSDVKGEQLEARDLLKLGGLVAVPMLLVLKQPDLGTTLTYFPVLVVGVILAGLRLRHAAIILVTLALVMPVSYFFLRDYQKARLLSFVDPSRDPKGTGYQLIQSEIAVGSGGIWGQGVTRGTQTQLRFLPVPHTDFIFSAFAEEHGFVGVVVVLGLYFLLLMQIVQNAQMAPDRAGMYVCMGVAALLLFHVLVNVGMVVGRMPVTGIPLPLMSSGGSNILSVFLMLGLVNNVRLHRL
ncbi:MAG TPA: rod shape-determining protein RodA [Bryobacteraceae bacterium]|jgi:rod shape determining protein RodA|nr:rod shape-determining protein RodA [Bryobacteraceae bacterium]